MLRFNNFLLERFNINNLPSNIILLTCDLDKDGGVFLLYDKDNKTPIGYISFGSISWYRIIYYLWLLF